MGTFSAVASKLGTAPSVCSPLSQIFERSCPADAVCELDPVQRLEFSVQIDKHEEVICSHSEGCWTLAAYFGPCWLFSNSIQTKDFSSQNWLFSQAYPRFISVLQTFFSSHATLSPSLPRSQGPSFTNGARPRTPGRRLQTLQGYLAHKKHPPPRTLQ